MTDRVPPKSRKKAKKGAVKKPTPKLAAKHGIGHNSDGMKNPAAIKAMDELISLGDQKKRLAKQERDIRNKFKTEFGVLAGTLAHEVRLRKMDEDVRVQFESNHQDLKNMLGYQPSLDFAGAQPTKASLHAQPTEAELKGAKSPEYIPPAQDENDPSPDEEELDEDDYETELEDEDEDGSVIEREG